MHVNLDAQLNESDRQNLQDMSSDLPSQVFRNKTIEQTLDVIKTENRKIGQHLGEKSKLNQGGKAIHQSRNKTLAIYRDIIAGLE